MPSNESTLPENLESDKETMPEEDIIETEEEVFIISDGGRPGVDHPGDSQHKFMPADKVYLCPRGSQNRKGPYLIERAENGKYTLCDVNTCITAEGGKWFAEEDMVLVSHFGN